MIRRRQILVALGLAVTALAGGAVIVSAENDRSEIALGRSLYAEHCAACHGAALEGQPNWKERLPNGRMPAPPHDVTGHTWHHSDDALFLVTKEGLGATVPGYESDMPAFGGILTDEEIRAVLSFIKSTWPERARDSQKARSNAEREPSR